MSSLDLTKSADVTKYLSLRASQIASYDKTFKGGKGQTVTQVALLKQEVLACGCILHEYRNSDGTLICERDWVDTGPHTDGAVLDVS